MGKNHRRSQKIIHIFANQLIITRRAVEISIGEKGIVLRVWLERLTDLSKHEVILILALFISPHLDPKGGKLLHI